MPMRPERGDQEAGAPVRSPGPEPGGLPPLPFRAAVEPSPKVDFSPGIAFSLKIDSPKIDFYTVAEVAARMQVSKMTVYRLVHSGELPAARVGRSFRVPRRAVEQHLRTAYVDAG
jgi:excisionase family DNA binding protein